MYCLAGFMCECFPTVAHETRPFRARFDFPSLEMSEGFSCSIPSASLRNLVSPQPA